MLRTLVLILLAALSNGARRSLFLDGGSINMGGSLAGSGSQVDSSLISFVPTPTPWSFCQLPLLNLPFSFSQHTPQSTPCFTPQINRATPTAIQPLPYLSPQNEFEDNKMKWEQSGIRYYSYQVEQLSKSGVKIEVGVCDGDKSSVAEEYQYYNSFDAIFSFVQSELQKTPYNVTLKYDPTFGFISYAFIDKSQFAAGEQFGFQIYDFSIQSVQNCVV